MRNPNTIMAFVTGIVLFITHTSIWAGNVSYQYDTNGRLTEADYGTKVINYGYDDNGNLLTRKVRTPIESVGCTGDSPTLSNLTYLSGQFYRCIAAISITAGPTVRVEQGADVLYRAPLIRLQDGFIVESGGVFQAQP